MKVQGTSAEIVHETRQGAASSKMAMPLAPAAGSTAAKPPPAALPASLPSPMPALPAVASPWAVPMDKLSASIASFARYFSLPLKPELIAEIRRQVFASTEIPTSDSRPTAETAEKKREALSLAAAACKDKGVELSTEGHKAYAAAIDPDWEERHGSGRRRRHNKPHDEGESPAERTKASPGRRPEGTPPLTAPELREIVESGAKDPLLAIMNKLPGKNGQHWVVLPFSFEKKGMKFQVSLRILLEENNHVSRMVLDIAESGDASRRWHFAGESAKGTLARLAVFMQPALSPKAHAQFARELSSLLAIPVGRISIQNATESFPCESPGMDDLLLSVNKSV